MRIRSYTVSPLEFAGAPTGISISDLSDFHPTSNRTPHYDYLILGGGIFGSYAALHLAGRGARVLLLERDAQLFGRASTVNQARLHSGYHYPRSVATARMSDENKARFTREHKPFINFRFEKFYAIDRYGSFTDAAQFERFCRYIDIPCERVERHPHFNYDRLEALYRTVEYTFDPVLVAAHYRERLAASSVEVRLQTEVHRAGSTGHTWTAALTDGTTIEAGAALNATYAQSNTVNRLFGLRDIDLMHEISEMAFVTAPALGAVGLTVMDGPFGSLMPYGKSGLLSLSSVAYTHHKVSYENTPRFDCMDHRADCAPTTLRDCDACPVRPTSSYRKMISQFSQYLGDAVRLDYFFSRFTVKSKLRANSIDDGRPTEISQLHTAPPFYCVFAGKINSIYEVERVLRS